ncbi:MAG TPA: type II secretion system F family protein [Azospirillum sp.]|nr:type II secretion system F family protein [Azospirillum sp.]
MDSRLLLQLLFAALAAGTVGTAVGMAVGQRRRGALDRRIAALHGPRGSADAAQTSVEDITLRPAAGRRSLRGLLDRALGIDGPLADTGAAARWTAAGLAAAAAAAALWVTVAFAGLPLPLGPPAAAAAALGAARWRFTRARRRTVARLLDQLPDAVGLVVRSIRSGIPVAESMRALADSMPAPTGPEFRRVADEVAVGVDLEAALWRLAERSDLPEYRFFVVAVVLQRETGGDLAETLGQLADVIRKRRALRQRGFALSAEARTSVWVLAALPFVAMGSLYVLSPAYVMRLFTTPDGKMLLGLAAVSLALGLLTMQAMIRKILA